MKQFSLLVLLLPVFSFAQEFTKPDSAAIINSHVKNVKIYYTGTGTNHLISAEMRYNKKGQLIYASNGSGQTYNSFTYYENGKTESIVTRDSQGKMRHKSRIEYTQDGRISKFYDFPTYDTLNPSSIYYYDSLRNIIREDFLTNGITTKVLKNKYDINKKLISSLDSCPGLALEYQNSKTVRQIYYNVANEVTESWTISYDTNGILQSTTCTTGNKTETYFVKFDPDLQPTVVLNGKKITKEEFVKWDYKFHYLFPLPGETEFALPYSDPVSNPVYVHTLKRDKAGNIKEDVITRGEPWIKEEPVRYDYEYTYW